MKYLTTLVKDTTRVWVLESDDDKSLTLLMTTAKVFEKSVTTVDSIQSFHIHGRFVPKFRKCIPSLRQLVPDQLVN